MKPESAYAQGNNAGNLGDLLKHYWLLRLLDAALLSNERPRIAYLESHAGAACAYGLYVTQAAKVLLSG